MMMPKRKDSALRTDRTLRYMRCFEDCVRALCNNSPIPVAVCYKRGKVYLEPVKSNNFATDSISPSKSNLISGKNVSRATDSSIYLFDAPVGDNQSYVEMINSFEFLSSNHVVERASVEYLVSNSDIKINQMGMWMMVTKIKRTQAEKNKFTVFKPPVWLLKHQFGDEEDRWRLIENPLDMVLTDKTGAENKAWDQSKEWLFYVDACYNMTSESPIVNDKFKPNMDLMKQMSEPPGNWSHEFDEDLAEMIKDHANTDTSGCIRNLIKNIAVSTQHSPEDTENLINLDRRTYWESDLYSSNYNGYNSIKLYIKPHKKIRRLVIVVSKAHKQFMPKDVVVMGGESPDDLVELSKVTINRYQEGDVTIMENCNRVYNYIEIQIKTCQRNGTNCRVYGVKMFTTADHELIPVDIFLNESIKRAFPRLGTYDPTVLYHRAETLLKFIKLFELCIDAMLPSWTYGEYFQNLIKSVKKLLILSPKRLSLIERILNSIPTTSCYFPQIYIDRPLAFAYRGKFNLDPSYQNTIFMQIYNNLSRNYSLRWEKSVEQWWECKFIGEGIIDQGGGFRDSLSDISEELCPNTGLDTPVPLPFFIRSPNQFQSDSNTFKDTFITNPSCNMFEEYEFIGKLMGACLRSKETLALFLAPFFWKKLSGEVVSWKNDFVTVDSAQVKLLDTIEKLDKEEYELNYGTEVTWSCNLSDGTLYLIKPNGNIKPVEYNDRLEYCEQVRHIRLGESDRQIEAIRRGLQSVISKHIFCLLTWSEFELKICGVPKISVEDLKMSIEYEEDMSSSSERVRFFWEAISNFSNDERSKFIRFVTGRKRLPVKIFFCSSDLPATSFPDSSTCNCSIYFPNYPNAQVAEEKLRYAIHNCVAIDTDCSSYDDL